MTELLKKQKNFFQNTHKRMVMDNHFVHNMDINYWDVLLKSVKYFPFHWSEKTALDIGCGCGRNIRNLMELALFKTVRLVSLLFSKCIPFNHGEGVESFNDLMVE